MARMHKILLAAVVAVLVVAVAAWALLSPKLLSGVRELLLKQVNESINGRLEVGKLDISVLGSAVLSKVALFDQTGNPVATSEEVAIRYSFSDLLAGKFDLDSVQAITVEKAELKLSIDSKGQWSLEKLMKPQKDRPSVFKGKFALRDVAVAVSTPNWQRNFSVISGDLDYSSPESVRVEVKGKMEKSSISAKGTWVPGGKTQLALTADELNLADAQTLLPIPVGTPRIQAGLLKDAKFSMTQDKSGIQMSGTALLNGLAVNLPAMSLKEGQAKLTLQGKKVTLSEATALIDGNKVSLAGNLDFTPASPILALQVNSVGMDLASMAGKKAAVAGKLLFQAEITGTLDKPQARGAFQLPEGKLDGQPLSGGEGSFSYSGETLTIQNGKVNAFGGALGISGNLSAKTARYQLKVVGQNVDGALLTDKGLSGRMSFDATVSGETKADSMTAAGTFQIPAGKVADYEIANAAGSFRKQGNRVELSQVGLSLSGQRLNVSGSIVLGSAGAALQLNLGISSSGLNTTVFNPNSALKGMIAFQATVTGTPDKNQARGSFQMGSGALGELQFSAGSGNFSYANGILTLSGGRAQCLGGTIGLNGTVVPKIMEYRQNVTGQNIDAALLTDRDVQGRADFSAVISGTGDWDKANGDGNFKMNAGSVKGISFNSLTGNFTKRGRQTEFTQLKFNMLGGLASGTGNTEGEYIRLIITPNAVANTALTILTGKGLQPQDLRIRFRGPNG